jgi:hypothetical protein
VEDVFGTDIAHLVRECRSCGAEIIWARTLSGRQMPVDAEPQPGGTVALENRQGFTRAVVYTDAMSVKLLGPEARQRLRNSHFATCPHADQWRHG